MTEVFGEPSKIKLDIRATPEEFLDLQYDILKGNSDSSIYEYDAQTYSSSSVLFNVTAPSMQAFLDRKAIMKVSARLVVTSQNGAVNTTIFGPDPDSQSSLANFFGGKCALRAIAPLQGVCSSFTAQINNTTLSYYPDQYMQAIWGHYGPYPEEANVSLGALGYIDQSWSYNDFASPRNPLKTFGDSSYGNDGRGSGFSSITVEENTPNRVEVIVTWYEQLVFPPFIPFNVIPDKAGLAGINSVNLNFNIAKLERLFSVNLNGIQVAPRTNVACAVSFAEKPKLYFTWLNSSLGGNQFMKPNKYGISLYNQYVTTGTTLNSADPSVSVALNTQVIQCSSIPSKIYLFVQRAQNERTIYTSDAFCRIESIDLTFGSKTGLLAGQNNGSLFQMSTRNGLKVSYPQFANLTGSVVCIDLQKDVSLGDLVVSNIGMYNLQLRLTVRNISYQANLPIDIMVVTSSEGILEIENGSAKLVQGLITRNERENAKLDIVPVSSGEEIIGGCDLSECTKMFAKKAAPIVRSAAKFLPGGNYIEQALDLAPKAYELYKMYSGQGFPHEVSYRKALEMTRGQGLVGGKAVKSKAKLRATLRN